MSSAEVSLRGDLQSGGREGPIGLRAGNESEDGQLRKRNTQARGRERREQLCAAALECIESIPIDVLTLSDVAQRAEVPKGSAYHFYANIQELYAELLAGFGAELCDAMFVDEDARIESWHDVVRHCVERAVEHLNASPIGRHLVLGPKVPMELKWSDRRNDFKLGMLMCAQIERYFKVPDFPGRDEKFFHAIELADLLFCLSVAEHGRVTDAMRLEGVRVACAYLGLYLAPCLPGLAMPEVRPMRRRSLA